MTEIVAAELVEPAPSAVACSETRADRVRELFAAVSAAVLCDLTLYRGEGFAGCAVLFLAAPILLLLGRETPRLNRGFGLVAGMILLLSVRLVWLGSVLGVVAGFVLIVASAMCLAGRRPYVLDVVAYALQTLIAGGRGWACHARAMTQPGRTVPRLFWLNVGLPLAAVLVFGTLFVLANPDLVTSFRDWLDRAWRALRESLDDLLPAWTQVLVWIVAAWVTVGLLRPVWEQPLLERFSARARGLSEASPASAGVPLYAAIRNVLAAVILLFAVYLVFEFKTLWFRVFPPGFHYSGYAHEGAAWLTAALALATVTLSAAFRGSLLDDPRLPRLRPLAWIWSVENLILAVAVFHRMSIYVGFNGMTRMRTVGLFGISAVVAGFILVVWKISHRRDFVWLLQRQLWTVAIAAYLFALTPVDALVHAYNVRRILAGDAAPSVQISVHPISAEGILVLHPLVHSRDPVIREGIRALLAERAELAEAALAQQLQQGWTAAQLADRLLVDQLRSIRSEWQPYAERSRRSEALERFHTYAYQWY
jgi:Arc/MetJ-type ribon-helix-helix transcriptional regulator